MCSQKQASMEGALGDKLLRERAHRCLEAEITFKLR